MYVLWLETPGTHLEHLTICFGACALKNLILSHLDTEHEVISAIVLARSFKFVLRLEVLLSDYSPESTLRCAIILGRPAMQIRFNDKRDSWDWDEGL